MLVIQTLRVLCNQNFDCYGESTLVIRTLAILEVMLEAHRSSPSVCQARLQMKNTPEIRDYLRPQLLFRDLAQA